MDQLKATNSGIIWFRVVKSNYSIAEIQEGLNNKKFTLARENEKIYGYVGDKVIVIATIKITRFENEFINFKIVE